MFRSVKSIVIAPANTGNESTSKKDVSNTLQMKKRETVKGSKIISYIDNSKIKLIDPKIDLAPAKWREKIAKSTAKPLWPMVLAKGG